jgi:hypothetical protein
MRRVLPLVFACCCLAAEEQPLPQGADVLPLVKKGVDLFTPRPPAGKPWAYDLAELTDHDPAVHSGAIRQLIDHGPEVLPDVTIVAGDTDWRIRARVAQVAAGIGNADGAALVLRLSRDPELRVREVCALGLGQCRGAGVYERLAELSLVHETTLREKAAQALGTLGDLRAIPLLADQQSENDDLVRRERRQALARLVQNPAGIAAALDQLTALGGDRRDALIEAVSTIPDRRLGPALCDIVRNPRQGAGSTWTTVLAVRALGVCGDRRAWGLLAACAADHAQPEVEAAAAASLTALTGYTANPGKAWTVWWLAHQGEAAHFAAFDAQVAAWHDPAAVPTREQLAAFALEDLQELVEACLGRPEERLAPWWPSLAWRAIAADDPARWCGTLADRAISAPSGLGAIERIACIAMIERLGGATATRELQRVLADLERRSEAEAEAAKKAGTIAPDHMAERKALALALGLPLDH